MKEESAGKRPRKHGILSDHKKVGKKLLPPFNYMLGGLREISYIDSIIPELIWIALLQDRCGRKEGVELARAFSKAAIESAVHEKKVFFGHVSAYAELSEEERESALTSLEQTGDLERLRQVLMPLISFYPECPLSFLFPGGVPALQNRDRALSEFKLLLNELYDRTSRTAVFALATFMYLGFLGDAVKVFENLTLAKFDEIEKYPSTDLSKQIASGIRSFALVFFGRFAEEKPSPWPRYFWNQGLKLEKCEFGVQNKEQKA